MLIPEKRPCLITDNTHWQQGFTLTPLSLLLSPSILTQNPEYEHKQGMDKTQHFEEMNNDGLLMMARTQLSFYLTSAKQGLP